MAGASSAATPSEGFFRDLERARTRALVEADMELAAQLHAVDYELITPGGAAMPGRQYLADIASGRIRYLVFEPASDMRVRINPGSGVVRYVASIDIRFGDEGEVARAWHTDIYEQRGGRWQAVWSHATRIPPA